MFIYMPRVRNTDAVSKCREVPR